MSKSQINAQIFTYVLTAVLIVFILIFSFRVFGSFRQKQRDATVLDLEEKLKAMVDLGTGEYGTIKKVELRVPMDTTRVCFFDLSKRTEIPQMFKAAYPEVYESLKDDAVPKNVFLLSGNSVTDALYAGNICLPDVYRCIETTDHYLRFLIEGQQGCVNIIKPLSSIELHNYKNMEKYDGNPIFMIADQTPDNILQYIPVAMWNDRKGGITLYPYYVYYEQGGNQPTDQFMKPIVQIHDHTVWKLRFLGGKPQNFAGGQVSYDEPPLFTRTYEEETLDFDNYIQYWQTSSLVDVVIIEKSNTDAAVIGALFGSYLIAPVIFMDSTTEVETYKDYIDNKRVYVVDKLASERAIMYIKEHSKEMVTYDSPYLRMNEELNPYRKIMSTMIPSNP